MDDLFYIGLIFQLLSIVPIGIGIYCIILFIKLGRRGIKAADIYIEKNKEKQ